MKPIILLCVIAIMLSFSACTATEEKQPETSSSAAEYVAKSGDTQVSGEITAIVGNEITVDIGTVTENKKDDTDSSADTNGSEMPEGMSFPDDMSMPDSMSFPDGMQPPDGMSMPDGMSFPDGMQPPEGMSMPDGMEMPSGNGGSRGGRKSSAQIEKTGESATYTIPVGLSVTGISGRSSDYSSLTVGTAIILTLDADGNVVGARVA